MSRQSELAELSRIYDSSALSNRNIIINGAMTVSQRGDYSSATSLTDDTYFLDRWVSDLATVSATIQNVSNGYLSKSKTQKLAATSSGTGRIVSIQKIEVSSYMLGVELTASAQVKSNSSNARLFLVDNTNGTVLGVQAHTGGGSFEKLTVSGTPPTTCTDLRVYVAFRSESQANVAITSGDYFEFTEVQLEVGDSATPFEHRSYGDELIRCQRYYFQSSKFGTSDTGTASDCIKYHSYSKSGSAWEWHQSSLPSNMRAAPTVTTHDGTTAGKIAHFTSNSGASTNNKTPYGVSAKKEYFFVHVYNESGIYGFNYNFKADAEL